MRIKVDSRANLASLLGSHMDDVQMEADLNIAWKPDIDFEIKMATMTKSNSYKVNEVF